MSRPLTLAATVTAGALLLSACLAPGSEEASGSPSTPAAAADPTPTHDAMDAMEPSPEPTPEPAPEPVEVPEVLQFEAMTVAGDTFAGADLAGKDSVLWFWASWCPSCQAEAPLVAAAISQLPEGVTLYGVPGNSDQAAMEAFVAEYGLESMVHIVDGDGSLWPAFGVPYQPAFAFVNDDGTVRTIQGSLGTSGIVQGAQDLAAS